MFCHLQEEISAIVLMAHRGKQQCQFMCSHVIWNFPEKSFVGVIEEEVKEPEERVAWALGLASAKGARSCPSQGLHRELLGELAQIGLALRFVARSKFSDIKGSTSIKIT